MLLALPVRDQAFRPSAKPARRGCRRGRTRLRANRRSPESTFTAGATHRCWDLSQLEVAPRGSTGVTSTQRSQARPPQVHRLSMPYSAWDDPTWCRSAADYFFKRQISISLPHQAARLCSKRSEAGRGRSNPGPGRRTSGFGGATAGWQLWHGFAGAR